ncbi:Surfactin synthase subunit 1 [Kordia antarctica]|uniref:Surfactin synthase subunit 1 n=1 Tax=Kordia antarctica TaxID=1218801 RepID=A0A7L4ZFX7_9FLAO|nr:non-ribosomal peptide synthetase [Kordia antarctica]QHI35399.1 Surfactin synthase subunit 1 [Kordia antarctica]
MENIKVKSAKSILKELITKNIKVQLDEKAGNIEVTGNVNSLTQDNILDIKGYKEEIIELLKTRVKFKNQSFQTIKEAPKGESYPLSNAQLRLWILSQYREASVAYNMPMHIYLNGSYEIDSFKKAIHAVIERHEILRTVFRKNDKEKVCQWILSAEQLNFKIDYQDYRTSENSDGEVEKYVLGDAYIPFDLEKGPLFRASLLQLSEDEYIFYFNLHHIISDGWSMEVLTGDVMNYYESFVLGKTPEITPLRIQYKDYTIWQLDQLTSNGYQEHKEYWESKLYGKIPTIDLPSTKIRPRVKTYKGHSLSTFIAADDIRNLRKFIDAEGGSLFFSLLGICNVLFYKYLSEKDITIGTIIAGRDHIDLEDQIGFYVNTLALRTQMDSNESFVAFYNRLKDDLAIAFNHQVYPFDHLVENINSNGDTSRSAIFDIMLILQNIGEGKRDVSVVDEHIISDRGACIAKFDLNITFKEEGEYLSFDVEYNTDVYEKEMVMQIMRHFKQLLHTVVSNPEKPIEAVELLSAVEKKELIQTLNDTEVTLSKQETILDLFQNQVVKSSEKIAIVSEEQKYTYVQLDQLSNQIADCLIKNYNIGSGDIVAIKMERNKWILPCILAIVKTGAAYLPIDTLSIPEREQFILDDANAKLLITTSNNVLDAAIYKGTQFVVDADFDPTAYASKPVNNIQSENDPVYIIYTSGSTGNPKGTLIQHHALLNYITWGKKYYLETLEEISFGLFTSIAFDLTVTSLFLPLVSGGTLTTYSSKDISFVLKDYIDKGISCIKLTPAHITLLDSLELKSDALKIAIVGGDALHRNHVDILRSINPKIKIYNEYGPTEATVGCIVHEVKAEELIVIGKPIDNTQVYIINEHDQLQPKGVIGELCIAGKGLSKGYINQPELTKEKFIENPFKAGELLYKTGDMAKRLPDGNIHFIGRVDDQVKIRGHRVEISEIEQYILQKPTIKDVAVIAKNTAAGKELVAYITTNEEEIEKVSDLHVFLSKRVPDYMIPGKFILLNEFPLTINGKVDKEKLQETNGRALSSEVVYEAPTTFEEKLMMEILQDIFKEDKISINDNFYHIGGDSIKSFQIINKIKQKGYSLKVEDILMYPIIKELAEHVVLNTYIIDQSEVIGDVKLTPIQLYLFNSPTIKNYSHNNQSAVLKSKEPIHSESLEKCAQKLVAHHDALRMTFTQTENEWKQYNTPINNDLTFVTFHDLSQEEDSLKMMGELANDIQKSFDLSKGPLFKIGHFRLQDGDYLALIVHHLVIDGISWRIILEDIASLYTNIKKEEELLLPLKSDSYKKWAKTLHSYSQSEVLEKELVYWREMCNQEIKGIPTDRPIEKETHKLDGTAHFVLDKKTTTLLKTEVPSMFNTEINDVLTTAFGLALKDVFDVDKCVIKMETHGREHIVKDIDVSRTVGWFTSIYPFVLDNASESSIKNLLKIKKDFRDVPNKGIGFWIAKYLKQASLKELKPTVEFNYLGDFGDSVGAGEGVFEYASAYIGESSDAGINSDVLISILGIEAMGELTLSYAYPTSLFDEDTMNALIKAYEKNLRGLIDDILSSEPSDYIEKAVKKTHYPVSHNQRYLMNNAQSVGMLGPYYYRFESEDKLRKTFQKFIEHYPVLAIKYTELDGAIIQTPIAATEVDFDVQIVNYSDEEKVEEISRNYLTDPYKTIDGQLIRLFVGINEDNGQSFLLVGIHHCLTDHHTNTIIGESLTNFLSDIKIIGDKTTNVDFVNWQQEFLQSETGNEYRKYWKNLLGSITYPTLKMLNSKNNTGDVSEIFYIENDLLSKLNDIHLKTNLPITGVLMAIHKKMMQDIFHVDSGIQITIANGREQQDENFDFAQNLGVMHNLLPLPYTEIESEAYEAFIRKGYTEYIKARAYQQIPYNMIKNDFNAEKGIDLDSHTKGIFSFRYVNNTNSEQEERKDHTRTTPFEMDSRINMTCVSSKNSIEIELVYPKSLAVENKVERYRPYFINILELFTENL